MRSHSLRCIVSACAIAGSGALVVPACASNDEPQNVPLGNTNAPLKYAAIKPLTQVYVRNAGALDIEGAYLPKVVCCENGAAHPEALKAQAVMARTYMYFKYYENGAGTQANPLLGTQSDQAYFCNNPVSQKCTDAVKATAGQVSMFTRAATEFLNVSFFVDGRRPACIANGSCSCPKPSAGTPMTLANHPADCQCFTFSSNGAAPYETYNWDKSGNAVVAVGAPMGNPQHESNRGCAGQNVQNCLGYAGWNYFDQLRMFYGQDLRVRVVGGGDVPEPGSTAPTADYAYAVSEATLPQRVRDGDSGDVRIVLTNTGKKAWDPAQRIRIKIVPPNDARWLLPSYASPDPDAAGRAIDQRSNDDGEVFLAGRVEPGASYRIDLRVNAGVRRDPRSLTIAFGLASSTNVLAGPSQYAIAVCDASDPTCATQNSVTKDAEDAESGCSAGGRSVGGRWVPSAAGLLGLAAWLRRRRPHKGMGRSRQERVSTTHHGGPGWNTVT